jgi:hypothetical protein
MFEDASYNYLFNVLCQICNFAWFEEPVYISLSFLQNDSLCSFNPKK